MSGKILHCWKDKREHMEERYGIGSPQWTATFSKGNGTCMRRAGHSGRHMFVSDEHIGVTFTAPPGDAAP